MSSEDEKLTPLMRRVQAQAEVLVPLLRHLRAALGTAEANALVYPLLRESVRDWVAAIAYTASDDPIENWQRTAAFLETQFEGDVAYDILRHDSEALDLNVSRCRYADYFRRLGEPELGAILTCELDDRIAELAGPGLAFSRPDTLMQGGAACPFRYRFATEDS